MLPKWSVTPEMCGADKLTRGGTSQLGEISGTRNFRQGDMGAQVTPENFTVNGNRHEISGKASPEVVFRRRRYQNGR